MIVPDVNLLLYAYDASNPFHSEAAKWWSECLSGDEPVGLPSVVLFGYLRISTNRKIFQNPLTVTQAGQQIKSWLSQPNARLLEPGPNHVETNTGSVERPWFRRQLGDRCSNRRAGYRERRCRAYR